MNVTFPRAPRTAIAGTRQPWTMHVPVVSTCHIKKEDDAMMSTWCDHDIGGVTRMHYGYLHVIEDWVATDELSPECNAVIQHFVDLGYSYLRFDSDGDIVDGLPVFEW